MTSVILSSNGSPLYVATDATLADDLDVENDLPDRRPAPACMCAASNCPRRTAASSGAFLSQIETALTQRELATVAESMRPVAEADRLRTALLAAVGHDLRRPLAAATAAVTSLRSAEVKLSAKPIAPNCSKPPTRASTALAALVTKLLDASRLQAGVLGVSLGAVSLDEIVSGALDELGLAPGEVNLELGQVPRSDGRRGAAAARCRQPHRQRVAILPAGCLACDRDQRIRRASCSSG